MERAIDLPLTGDKYNIEALHEHFMQGGVISNNSISKLLTTMKAEFKKEPNLIELQEDCLIFGDLHGQYFDFISELEDDAWKDKKYTMVFLGDYVDRGEMSTEILITLFCMKLNGNPKVVLLRGNHESRSMTSRYGFQSEVVWKYNEKIYQEFCDVFDCLPLVVVLKLELGNFFLCHGGISPHLQHLKDIDGINRFCEPPRSGLFCDLLWADPVSEEMFDSNLDLAAYWEKINYIQNEQRRCSYVFGYIAIVNFINNTNIRGVVRGHQCVSNGIEMHKFGDESMVSPLAFTLFSAPNYSDCNKGAGMLISNEGINIRTYDSSELVSYYNPCLRDPLIYSLKVLMTNLSDAWDDFLYFMFYDDQEDQEDQSSDTLDIAHLAQHIQEYYETSTQQKQLTNVACTATSKTVVVEEVNKDVQHVENVHVETPMKAKKRKQMKRKQMKKHPSNKLSSSFSEKFKEQKQTKLAASIVTEQPTRCLEESSPLSIEQLREHWKSMQEKHHSGEM
ncbi:Serine/threonine-protein phosphatase [Entamoeba marina]